MIENCGLPLLVAHTVMFIESLNLSHAVHGNIRGNIKAPPRETEFPDFPVIVDVPLHGIGRIRSSFNCSLKYDFSQIFSYVP